MLSLTSWLRNHISVERLAVAVFLAVGVGLWWGMLPGPEVTLTVPVVLVNDLERPLQFLFSPNGSMLAAYGTRSGSLDCRLYVFDTATGAELWRTDKFVWAVEWTTDQQLLLSHSLLTEDQHLSRGKIMTLDPRTGTMTECFSHPKLRWARFLISPNRKTLAIRGSGEDFEGFWLIDVPSRKEITSTLYGRDDTVFLHGFSPDSRFFLVRLPHPDGGQMTLYDIEQRKVTLQFSKLDYSELEDLHAFSRDGRILALGRERAYTWKEGRTKEEGATLVYSPFKDTVVHLWNTQTGQSLGTIPVGQGIADQGETAHDQLLDSLFLVQGGSQLCVVTGVNSPERSIRAVQTNYRTHWPEQSNLNLFDVRTGRLVHRQLLACDPKTDATDRLLCMESRDGERRAIRVRDLQQGQDHVWTVDDHAGYEHCLGFGHWRPEQEVLICSQWRYGETYNGKWKQARIWFLDPVTGKEVDRWRFSSPVSRIILSPDGSRLLVGHIADGQEAFELYSLPPHKPMLHIFGWALAAGGVVELLGALLRRRRRQRAALMVA